VLFPNGWLGKLLFCGAEYVYDCEAEAMDTLLARIESTDCCCWYGLRGSDGC